MRVYESSFDRGWDAKDLLDPDNSLRLTRGTGLEEEGEGEEGVMEDGSAGGAGFGAGGR